jgi:hypothetical protein
MRWDVVVYALILIGIAVGWIYFPARYSNGHFAVTVVGVGLLFVVRRLSTGQWGSR